MTDSTLKSAQKLLVNGVAPREVARNLGVSVPTLYRWVPAASLPVSITASLNALWCPFSGATSFRLLAALPSGLAYSVVRCVTRPLNMLLAAKRLI
ncbi:hypothetical protein [Candidatus Glomeribacter gigasporarum]|uniref:hypothetical protein n=1 Tax=Candidatus Glomeribacter gigasporarum TaxID=132144 RepID=UPI003B9683EC